MAWKQWYITLWEDEKNEKFNNKFTQMFDYVNGNENPSLTIHANLLLHYLVSYFASDFFFIWALVLDKIDYF